MSRSAARLSARLQIAFSSASLVFGLAAAVWFGPRMLVQSNATLRFEPVPAVVESIAVRERSRSKGPTRYDVDIAFRYEVDGQSHVGTTWRVGGSPSSARREKIAELVARHPVGSAIDVLVDPEDASVAVVERGGSDGAWLLILMGCFFGGLGALGVRHGLRRFADTAKEVPAGTAT